MGISREQALDCFRSDDLVGIGMEADAVRRRLHPEGVVSYVRLRRIDCAAMLGREGAGDSDFFDGVCEEIREAVEMGASGVRFAGAAAGVEGLEGLLRGVRRRFPSVWIEGLSAAEVVSLAEERGLEVRETILRLMNAGLDSIAGEGAERLDGMRELDMAQWIDVHRAAHRLGMRTGAGMVFGAGETAGQTVDRLEAVRQAQEETGGFSAFVPVAAAAPSGRELDSATAVERLKTLAISRMFLDNIENVQSSRAGQGLKVLQTGLRFGANDAGEVGVGAGASEEDLRRVIRDAGFRPVERDAPYRTMFLS